MKIVWFSGRVIGNNLASTTEIELTKNLTIQGFETTLISPGKTKVEVVSLFILFNQTTFMKAPIW